MPIRLIRDDGLERHQLVRARACRPPSRPSPTPAQHDGDPQPALRRPRPRPPPATSSSSVTSALTKLASSPSSSASAVALLLVEVGDRRRARRARASSAGGRLAEPRGSARHECPAFSMLHGRGTLQRPRERQREASSGSVDSRRARGPRRRSRARGARGVNFALISVRISSPAAKLDVEVERADAHRRRRGCARRRISIHSLSAVEEGDVLEGVERGSRRRARG